MMENVGRNVWSVEETLNVLLVHGVHVENNDLDRKYASLVPVPPLDGESRVHLTGASGTRPKACQFTIFRIDGSAVSNRFERQCEQAISMRFELNTNSPIRIWESALKAFLM